MSRGQLTKPDVLYRVLKLKNHLKNGTYGQDWSTSEKRAVNNALSDVLDIINEWRY